MPKRSFHLISLFLAGFFFFSADVRATEVLDLRLQCHGELEFLSDRTKHPWSQQIHIENNFFDGRNLEVSDFKIEVTEWEGNGMRYHFGINRMNGQVEWLRRTADNEFFLIKGLCELMQKTERKF